MISAFVEQVVNLPEEKIGQIHLFAQNHYQFLHMQLTCRLIEQYHYAPKSNRSMIKEKAISSALSACGLSMDSPSCSVGELYEDICQSAALKIELLSRIGINQPSTASPARDGATGSFSAAQKTIIYLKGSPMAQLPEGIKIIPHLCNDSGGWSRGFALAISKRWKEPERQYRKWHKERNNFRLGEIRLVRVEPYAYVANMIALKGVKPGSKDVPISYEAVEKCLNKLSQEAIKLSASVHMPRIGCGGAGGKWEKIEPLISDALVKNGTDVFVYDN